MASRNSTAFGQKVLPIGNSTRNKILCVGDPLRDCHFPPSMRYAAGVEVVGWPLLAEKLSMGETIRQVFSATISHNFDCMDIAQILYRNEFRGRYRVIAPDIPKPGLIRREVAAICPGLDFDIELAPPPTVIRVC